jgi:hypothetical protein
VTSIIGQFILIFRRNMRPVYAVSLFWLSFWTYLSPVVYLLMGAIRPFGDILDLINAVPVSGYLIGSLGIMMLISCTYLLSQTLRDIFSNVLGPQKASDAVSYFWALLHTFFVLVTIVTYGLPAPPVITVTSMVVIFIWSYIMARWLLVFVSRQGGAERLWPPKYAQSSMSSASPEDRDRRLKLGYAVLFSAALVSMLLTGYMVNQYLSAYRVVMKTDIEIEVVHVELGPNEPVLNLSVSVFNPSSEDVTLDRMEFDVKLNGKFMQHYLMQSIPAMGPESTTAFNRAISLPMDRMFTIEEAMSNDSWAWTVSGSGHVVTMFGETLLRFESDSICEPQVG